MDIVELNRERWVKRWDEQHRHSEPGWQNTAPHRFLQKHYDQFYTEVKNPTVFVPLCGKSLDMIYFATHGYNVIGVELSEIGVLQFFTENKIDYKITKKEKASVYETEPNEKLKKITIICGDLFEAEFEPVDAIYDRASLYALPSTLRPKYVQKLLSLLKENGLWFGIIHEKVGKLTGPPFSVSVDDIKELFTGYEVKQIDQDDHAIVAGDTCTKHVLIVKNKRVQ
jgi:thiopurine S-methyltransferase